MRQSQKHKCPTQSTCKPPLMKVCEKGSGERALSKTIFPVSEILRELLCLFTMKIKRCDLNRSMLKIFHTESVFGSFSFVVPRKG